jgi:hypothetical protein
MLIPVNPSKNLHPSGRRPVAASDDVTVEHIDPVKPEEPRVGQARVSGRTAAINRKGPS